MRRGPKPIPTVEKIRRGNTGHRPLNADEPTVPACRLTCPEWMDAEARKEWERVEPLLAAAGITTGLDRAVLVAYCRAWSQWVKACLETDKFGAVLVSPKTMSAYQGAFVNVEVMYEKQLRACEVELGMTPSSRTRIHAIPEPDGKPEGKGKFFADNGLKLIG